MQGDAKKKMLKALSDEMRSELGEGYKDGLKEKMMKVTVAGDDKESVSKGLDKAKEIMSKRLGPMEDLMEDSEEDAEDDSIDEEDVEEMDDDAMEEDYDDESPLEELAEEEAEEESPEDIKAKIEELQAKLSMIGE